MQDSERDDATSTPDGPAPGQTDAKPTAPRRRRDEEPPTIPERPFDETDAAWGDHPQHSDDWWNEQRPPHHGG